MQMKDSSIPSEHPALACSTILSSLLETKKKLKVTTGNNLKFRALNSILLGLNFAFMEFSLKILGGMANSLDPDQTAPSGAV